MLCSQMINNSLIRDFSLVCSGASTQSILFYSTGVSAAFAVKLFKSWIYEKDINSVAGSLRKVGMDNRLMVSVGRRLLKCVKVTFYSIINILSANAEWEGGEGYRVSEDRSLLRSTITAFSFPHPSGAISCQQAEL